MIPALQYLRHGKALCGKVFRRFVETFNYHNDFVANLKGDGDLPTSCGVINLDRTDPFHPVIRLNKNNLKIHTGESATIPGRFEISLKAEDPQESDEEEEQEQTYSATFANPYYEIGGKTYEMPADEEADPPAVGLGGIKDGDIIVLKIAAGQSRGEELVTVGSLAELQTLQEDVAYYSIPLYKVQGGSVVCDFRTGPISGMGEFAS